MRTIVKRLLLVTINVAVPLGLLALAELTFHTVQEYRLGPKSFLPEARMDRWTAWRNMPGYERIDIHHNSQGFRHDTELTVEKPPNTVRIFLLGGSAAYGREGFYTDLDPGWTRVYNRDLIDAHLQKMLQEHHPERQWEVINAATSEFRMHQHLALIEAELLRYKPDLIIFMDGHNDMSGIIASTTVPYDAYAQTPHELEFYSAVYPRSLRSWLFINASWLRNNSALFAALQRRVRQHRREEAIGGVPDARGKPAHIPVLEEDLSPALRQRANENLTQAGYYVQMAERLQKMLSYEGVEAMFSLQPELILSDKPLTPVEARFVEHTKTIYGPYVTYMYENLRPRISRDMTESSARNHYVYVDLGDTFRDVKEKAFSDYCHLTPLANQLIAQRLFSTMSRELIAKLESGKRSLPMVTATGPH